LKKEGETREEKENHERRNPTDSETAVAPHRGTPSKEEKKERRGSLTG